METPTTNQLLAELVASFPVPYDPAIHVIRETFSIAGGISLSAAGAHLRKLARAGQLKAIHVRFPNGSHGTAYVKAG